MDLRITALVDDLTREVDPELGKYVKELGVNGMSYDDIVAKLTSLMRVAAIARQEG